MIAYLDGYSEKDFEGSSTRLVTQPRWEGKVMTGKDYFFEHVQPNFYFHAAHTYAILRHNGVPIGKKDYLGRAQPTLAVSRAGGTHATYGSSEDERDRPQTADTTGRAPISSSATLPLRSKRKWSSNSNSISFAPPRQSGMSRLRVSHRRWRPGSVSEMPLSGAQSGALWCVLR